MAQFGNYRRSVSTTLVTVCQGQANSPLMMLQCIHENEMAATPNRNVPCCSHNAAEISEEMETRIGLKCHMPESIKKN